MDVKEAAQAAKEYVLDLFSDEIIGGVSLEEVEFDDGYPKRWKITVSFIRDTSET